tara:strand:+ start:547 stop:735 length:189 start_codon:yes stop_codon:yes gene_type:complete
MRANAGSTIVPKMQGSKFSLNYTSQQRECNRINKENVKMAQTLMAQRPTINMSKTIKDYENM